MPNIMLHSAQRKRNAVADLSQDLITKQIKLCEESIEYLELKKRHEKNMRILKSMYRYWESYI